MKNGTGFGKKERENWWYVLELIAGIDATGAQKYFLTLVYRHTNWRKGFAWASQKTLGREMCVEESTAKRTYRWAKRLGVINSRLVRAGKVPEDQHNEYSLNIERLKELQRPSAAGVCPQRSTGTEDSTVPTVLLDDGSLGASAPPDIDRELRAPMPSKRGQITPELGANNTRTRSTHAPIGTEVKQVVSNNSLPACSFEARQVHANAPVEARQQQKNGNNILLLNRTPRSIPESTALRTPPVILYLQKNHTLPPYILDETHLILDGQGEFVGYFDRNGNRRNKWNEFESIGMAQRRTSKEAISAVFGRARSDIREDEQRPPQTTPEQRMKMLRSGTEDPTEAQHWSALTGFPADIFLTRDAGERAELFRRWREEARQNNSHQLGRGPK